MTSGEERTIRAAAELSAGDEIEAWHHGRLFHYGRVLRVLASVGLFWIQDERTGTRRLLDVDALEIVRVNAGGRADGGQAEGGRAGGGLTANGRLAGGRAAGGPPAPGREEAARLWFSSSR